MAIQKGKSGNPKGRPKGKPNKVSTTLREYIAALIDNNRANIQNDLDALEPKDRLMILERLLAYVLPKQTAQSVTLENLTNEQITDLAANVAKSINE